MRIVILTVALLLTPLAFADGSDDPFDGPSTTDCFALSGTWAGSCENTGSVNLQLNIGNSFDPITQEVTQILSGHLVSTAGPQPITGRAFDLMFDRKQRRVVKHTSDIKTVLKSRTACKNGKIFLKESQSKIENGQEQLLWGGTGRFELSADGNTLTLTPIGPIVGPTSGACTANRS